MKETVTSRILWNNAGKTGAILGLVSAAFMFISQATAGIGSPIAVTALNMLLWTAKFIGCIWLMRHFMLMLCSRYEGVTNSVTMKYGTIVAFLSALIYSAFLLANLLFITPDLVDMQFDQVMQMYSGMLDSNSLTMMENMRASYPQIAFFSQLIYCFLYGTLLSFILSRYIPKNDPFANYGTGEDEQQQK